MNNLLWMLDGSAPDASGMQGEFLEIFKTNIWPWVSTILWVLVAILAVVFIVKAITTALAVVKAADEPQVRQEKLGSFKYLAIGLAVAIIVISMANVIVNLIINNSTVDNLDSAFLF